MYKRQVIGCAFDDFTRVEMIVQVADCGDGRAHSGCACDGDVRRRFEVVVADSFDHVFEFDDLIDCIVWDRGIHLNRDVYKRQAYGIEQRSLFSLKRIPYPERGFGGAISVLEPDVGEIAKHGCIF